MKSLVTLLLCTAACGNSDKASSPIPGVDEFKEYKTAAESSEFSANLRRMALGAKEYMEGERWNNGGLGMQEKSFPATRPEHPPGGVTCDKKPATTDWSAWDDLYFEVHRPFYGHYSFENNGESFVARVRYDIDCDGNPGEQVIEGKLEPDGTVSIGKPKQVAED